MNYQQIRAFHLVALEQSVGRAAEVMGLSQPTVSQHLKALEERHGIRLFQKQGRGLALTQIGAELFEVTKRLLEQAGEVDDLLSGRNDTAAGRLRVVSDSPPIAIHIVRRLLASHPDIDVSICKDSVGGIVDALVEMRADVGLAVDPLIGSTLRIIPLWQERLMACLPVDNPLARRDSFDLPAISGQTLIQREKGSRTRALVERAMIASGVSPERIIEVDGAEIVREAVALSLGVSFFAQSECPPDPRLRYLPLVAPKARTYFVENLLVRRDRRHQPEISAFLLAANAERQERGL